MLYFFTKEIDVFAYAFFIAKHGGKNIVKRIIADTDRRKKLIKRFVMFFVDNDLKKQHSKIKPQVQVNIPHNNIYYNKEIPIISVYEMEDFCKRNPDSIIILAVSEIHQLEIERQLCGIKNTILNLNTFKVLFIRENVD